MIAQNTSANTIHLSWKPPAIDTIHGEFLGYRITYKVRDSKDSINEILIRESAVEVNNFIKLITY
jgi:receptor-type tyrosine-protein phosphatase gamma